MNVKNSELIAAVDWLKAQKIIKSNEDIASKIGYSKGVLSEYLNNKKKVSELFMRKFYEAYPQTKSSQIKEKSSPKRTKSEANARLLDMDGKAIMNVPVVNQFAYAGYLRGYSDAEYVESLPKMPWLVDREYKGLYCTFEVRGDSMDDGSRDSYMEGDMLLCREISRDHWSQSKLHIRKWDFVIVHKTEGILVKRIVEHNVEKGKLKLHSLNDLYPDFEVNLKDIAQIFNVVQVARKK